MHLRYVNKLGIPKDIKLTGEPLAIGRAREADIPLLDDKVSRIHCGIRLSAGEFYLKDLKSRNGTYVNGQRVEDTIKLKVGDRIQVGSTVFVLDTSPYEKDAADGIAADKQILIAAIDHLNIPPRWARQNHADAIFRRSRCVI